MVFEGGVIVWSVMREKWEWQLFPAINFLVSPAETALTAPIGLKTSLYFIFFPETPALLLVEYMELNIISKSIWQR